MKVGALVHGRACVGREGPDDCDGLGGGGARANLRDLLGGGNLPVERGRDPPQEFPVGRPGRLDRFASRIRNQRVDALVEGGGFCTSKAPGQAETGDHRSEKPIRLDKHGVVALGPEAIA